MSTLSPTDLDHVPDAPEDPAWGQSLASGALGPALYHLTRSDLAQDAAPTAHAWLQAATRAPVSSHADGALFCGVTSLAYTLSITRAGPVALRQQLHEHVLDLTRHRLDHAHQRLTEDATTTAREYDVIGGLCGLGAYLLATEPEGTTTSQVLSYLVALTEPRRLHGTQVPGWWTHLSPKGQESEDFAHGHANLGLAHGITGPLALLALARLRGVYVPGQVEAIERVATFLDTWRQQDCDGLWWPRWITWPQLHGDAPLEPNPMRPAWCYGVPGQARALQLAALALRDTPRANVAVAALADVATDVTRLAQVNSTLCHGRASLLQTLRRAADDDPTKRLENAVVDLECQDTPAHVAGTGLLEGSAGWALSHLPTPAHRTRWDTCLLITN